MVNEWQDRKQMITAIWNRETLCASISLKNYMTRSEARSS